MKRYLASSLIIAIISSPSMAQYRITPLHTSHISIFKNGTFFITKEGEADPENGVFAITPPSTALNGTFWVAAGKENKIRSIAVKPDTIKVVRTIEDISDYIGASIGKNISIVLPPIGTVGAAREIKGEVLNFFSGTQMVKLKTADGRILMCNVSEAKEVYGDNGNANTYLQDSVVRMAKVYMENKAANVMVSTVALQTGMSWVPSYFLKLTDEKYAKLDLKATILNTSSENIYDAPVDIVIGNPNMFYGTKLDEVSTDFFVNRVLSFERPLGNYLLNTYSNSTMQAPSSGDVEDKEEATIEMPAYATQGEKTNDLYYFNLGKLNLESQSKTIVPLLTNDITYKEVYTLDVNEPGTQSEVWHLLKMQNTGKAPFTTGPIFVLDEKDRPLAQDEMKYTATGATADIHLGKAIDILSKNTETIISKTSNTKVIDEHTYGVALMKGKIEITNFQNRTIKINITKNLTGKMVQAADAQITTTPLTSLNVASHAKWEKEIAAGQKIELTYTYEMIVP